MGDVREEKGDDQDADNDHNKCNPSSPRVPGRIVASIASTGEFIVAARLLLAMARKSYEEERRGEES